MFVQLWYSDQHRKTLGVLWAIYGAICAIEVVLLAMYSEELSVMFGALLARVPNPNSWMGLFHFALVAAVAMLVLTTVFSFMAATALLSFSRGRYKAALVAGFFGLLTGPLGIALGVFTLVQLLLPWTGGESYERLAEAA
jgi:hypothetical protein